MTALASAAHTLKYDGPSPGEFFLFNIINLLQTQEQGLNEQLSYEKTLAKVLVKQLLALKQ